MKQNLLIPELGKISPGICKKSIHCSHTKLI